MTAVDLTMKQDGKPYWDFAHWQGNPNNKSRQVQFLDRAHSVFGSTHVFRAECIKGDDWPQSSGNSAPRCLVGAWTSNQPWYPAPAPVIPYPRKGERFIVAVAIEVLPNIRSPLVTLWELHHSNQLATLSPVAPLSLFGYTDGNLYARLCGGEAKNGGWQTYWNLLKIAPAVPGVHMMVYDVKYSLGNDGYLDVYHALNQDYNFAHPVSQHTGQPTWPWGAGLPDEKMYQETGIYPNGSVTIDTNAVAHYGSEQWFNAQETDLQAAFASFQFDGGTTPTQKPILKTKPVVSGTLLVDKKLYCSDGEWVNGPTSLSYQWQYSTDNGATWQNVSGATTNEFVCASTFIGNVIRVQVTATNSAGNTAATSDATPPVADVPPVSGFQVRKRSELASSITLEWDADPNQLGFLPLIDGSPTLTDHHIHPNLTTQNWVQIGKPRDGLPHVYGVMLMTEEGSIEA